MEVGGGGGGQGQLGCRVDGFVWVVANDVERIGGQALQAFDPEFVLLPEQVDSFAGVARGGLP